jgi:carboxyl-terminal processing protease
VLVPYRDKKVVGVFVRFSLRRFRRIFALEVERLKKRTEVDGIVLDVRDDGGGSLSTVVDVLVCLLNKGPIVQIKSAEERRKCCMIVTKNQYDGP